MVREYPSILRTCDPIAAWATMAEALFAPPLPTTKHDMHAPIWKDQNINLQATIAIYRWRVNRDNYGQMAMEAETESLANLKPRRRK
jgi:hypothetical protein